ncbi:MAG: PTS glucose transporter subunit IIA [Anaerorhabdus sp.]
MKIFNNSKDNRLNLVAPVSGEYVDITTVDDPVFSTKLMGDGFAIIPCEDTIVAPCDGEIVMLFNTKHAFGIKSKEGVEILVHIGINTVESNGEGFKALSYQNAKVKKGMPIIKFDKDKLSKYDLVTMVIITALNGKTQYKECEYGNVQKGDLILSLK